MHSYTAPGNIFEVMIFIFTINTNEINNVTFSCHSCESRNPEEYW